MAPDKLGDLALIATGAGKARSPQGPYSGHVDPLYNFHEGLNGASFEETQALVRREGGDWNAQWRKQAQGLSGKVKVFALAAYDQNLLAGHIRFLPSSIGHLLSYPEGFARRTDENALLIVAGCVDIDGAADGLDVEMVRRVVAYARQGGYAKVQALAWSNIRAYAMWGEQFPLSAYEAADFRKVASMPAWKEPFDDMLAGAHGPEIQKMVQGALDKGMTEGEATTLWLVEMDLR